MKSRHLHWSDKYQYNEDSPEHKSSLTTVAWGKIAFCFTALRLQNKWQKPHALTVNLPLLTLNHIHAKLAVAYKTFQNEEKPVCCLRACCYSENSSHIRAQHFQSPPNAMKGKQSKVTYTVETHRASSITWKTVQRKHSWGGGRAYLNMFTVKGA